MTNRYAMVALAAVVISGCAREPVLQPFTSGPGRYSVSIPGQPKEESRNVPTPVGPIAANISMVESRNKVYSIIYSDYPVEVIRKGNPDAMLDGARDGAVANVQGGKLLDSKEIAQDGFPGREFSYELNLPGVSDKALARARIFLVNQRLFQVIVLGTQTSAKSGTSDAVFASFKFEPGPELPPEEPTVQAAPAVPKPNRQSRDLAKKKDMEASQENFALSSPATGDPPTLPGPGTSPKPKRAGARKGFAGRKAMAPPIAAGTVGWTIFKTKDGGFSIKVPVKMEKQAPQPGSIPGAKTLSVFTCSAEGVTYTVQVQIIPPVARSKGVEAVLDASRDALAKEAKGEAVGERVAALGDYPAREYRIDAPSLQPEIVRVRSSLINGRLFDVFVTASEPAVSGEAVGAFFNSFKVSP